MNEYYCLAWSDTLRFGSLHAMDKVHWFEGEDQNAYAQGIKDCLDHLLTTA